MALDVNDYIAQKLAQSSLSGSTGKTRLAALEEVNDGTVRIFDPKTLRSELPRDWVHGYDAEKGQGLASKGHGPLYKEDLADLCVEVRFDDRTQTLTKDGQLIPYTRLTEKFPEPTDEEYASLDKAKATIEARRGKTLEKWELKSWINRDKATALLNEVGLTYGYEIKVADGTREIDGRTVRNNQRSGDAKTFQTDHGPRARTTHFQNQTRSGMNLPDGRRENLQTGIIQGYNRTADDGKKEWTEHDWKADAGNPNEIRLHLLSEGIHTHDTDYMRQKE